MHNRDWTGSSWNDAHRNASQQSRSDPSTPVGTDDEEISRFLLADRGQHVNGASDLDASFDAFRQVVCVEDCVEKLSPLGESEFAQLIVRARDGARARNQWDVSDMHEDQAPLEPVAQYSGEGYGPRSSGRAVNSADNRRCNHVDLLAPLACPWLSSCAMGRGLHVR